MEAGRDCETALYEPVRSYLAGQGYSVKGEVSGFDVLAVKEEAVVAVELKRNLTLKLVLQAVDRLEAVEWVYVAVPDSCPVLRSSKHSLLRLLKMLGIGLLLVDAERSSVFPVLDPCDYRPRNMRARRIRLLREFEALAGDPNKGGSGRRRGLMTAYRQRALAIAAYLSRSGPAKASVVCAATGEKDALDIMYRNVYGWFERLGNGIYALSPRGVEGLAEWMGRFPV